jgi:Clp amino terminal domain, pathogenicity island component
MFERFTDRARRVVVLAQDEARMLDHNYIGTEHILLGLLHEGESAAARALESLGVSLQAARQQVVEIIGRGQEAPSGHIPFTPRAKKVLELSLREALQLGNQYIGPGHILLGLIREGQGVAVQVIVRMGADTDSVRDGVTGLLRGEPEPEVTPEAGARSAGATRPAGDAGSALVAEIRGALSSIADRLAAIEHHLGMRDKPEEPKPEAAESGPAESGRAESGRAESGRAESGPAESGLAESGLAESGRAESGPAESGLAESGPAESGAAEPGAAEPGAAEPEGPEPGATEPGGPEHGAAEPGAAGDGSS